VVKAAAFGVPLPLCSCGVIPVAASLHRQGAGRGATTAFLISTPQTGVDSIFITYGLLGPVFAIFRPIAALVTGIIGGLLVAAADGDHSAIRQQNFPGDEGMEPADGHGRGWRALHYGFVALPRDIGKALLVGLVVAALISALTPRDYFAHIVPPGILQILLLMVVGIPIYVCATASVPLAYALIMTGVSPGAAFAFLMTGPATNAATIATVWKVLGAKTAAIYLATMAAAAVAGGLLLDRIVTGAQVLTGGQAAWMLPMAVRETAAIVLLALLLFGVARPWLAALGGAGKEGEAGMRLKITGMTCSHCAARVREALLACPGVSAARVDLDRGAAWVEGSEADQSELLSAVRQAGYGAESLDEKGSQDGT
jgi:uncharacterized membrane protein YraQ (UPF0718 family)/copper chaperone CopZ